VGSVKDFQAARLELYDRIYTALNLFTATDLLACVSLPPSAALSSFCVSFSFSLSSLFVR